MRYHNFIQIIYLNAISVDNTREDQITIKIKIMWRVCIYLIYNLKIYI